MIKRNRKFLFLFSLYLLFPPPPSPAGGGEGSEAINFQFYYLSKFLEQIIKIIFLYSILSKKVQFLFFFKKKNKNLKNIIIKIQKIKEKKAIKTFRTRERIWCAHLCARLLLNILYIFKRRPLPPHTIDLPPPTSHLPSLKTKQKYIYIYIFAQSSSFPPRWGVGCYFP